jgi:hypothetical protein
VTCQVLWWYAGGEHQDVASSTVGGLSGSAVKAKPVAGATPVVAGTDEDTRPYNKVLLNPAHKAPHTEGRRISTDPGLPNVSYR